MKYNVENLRNICLLGHGGDGKTSLAEALLYYTDGTDRMGKTADGNTVCDYDPEEIARKISISSAIAPIERNGVKLNIIDTPGYFDFEGEVIQALKASEFAIIVLSAKDGINVGTEKAVKLCAKYNVPAMFYISKMDEEHSDFQKVYADLKATFGAKVCAINAPIFDDNGKNIGYVDLNDMTGKRFEKGKRIEIPIPASMSAQLEEFKEGYREALAETSDEMMEKFFAGEEFSVEETKAGLVNGLETNSILPVMSGSPFKLMGLEPLLHFLSRYIPTPKASATDPTALYIFKTVADPFVGKMSFFKILSGTVKAGMTLSNTTKDTDEKIGKIYTIKGKTQTEVTELCAGDIGVLTKLNAATGDVLAAPGATAEVEPIEYPKPCLSMAIMPKAKGDEDKISQGLQKLAEEDLTFSYTNNKETKQMVISGMGEMHLSIIASKLKNKFNVGVTLEEPKVPYRESIKKKVSVRGRHKKQSGGHGQFGDVVIEFEPYDGEELLFEEKVFGGAVPKNFFPAVEKGLKESAKRGVLAGYPVVGLKATLVDGSYHPVDSSEMSFKMAASIAYKEGLKQAAPTILEPVGSLKVLVPDSIMGDVIGDINKRRGQVMGMNPAEESGMQIVEAEVPVSEMATYAIDLRSMTRGRGSFDFEFVRYQDAPSNVAQKVIEDAKDSMTEE